MKQLFYSMLKGIIEERKFGSARVFVPYIGIMGVYMPIIRSADGRFRVSFDSGLTLYYITDAQSLIMQWFEYHGVSINNVSIEYRRRLL